MSKYTYSVIIPCYDATDLDFARCLDSIENQTFRPLEVICIDDCSPVKTPQLAKYYGYTYIRHKENLNNGGARNTGIRAAKGDYLVFVNSDDYIVKVCHSLYTRSCTYCAHSFGLRLLSKVCHGIGLPIVTSNVLPLFLNISSARNSMAKLNFSLSALHIFAMR